MTSIPTRGPAEKEIRDALALLKKTPFQEIQRLGFHFQTNDFYSPLNDVEFLKKNGDLWKNPETCREIDWNLECQIKVAGMVGDFVDELRDVPLRNSGDALDYCWENHFWNSSDALVQYGILRGLKPGQVTEVGCGWSSMLMERALEKNKTPCDVIQIEPYPNREIFKRLPAAWVHHECILQRAPLVAFERLQAGDICFYDGSHCAKTASDVNWFFFEILPRLAPGVVIHIHDIFLPEPYPEPWIFERGQTWNEQYILQAFLMHNHDYEIMMGNRYLWKQKAAFLDGLYKGIQPSYGCSFWMKKIK